MSRPPTPSDGNPAPPAHAQTPNGPNQQIAPAPFQPLPIPRQLAMSQSPVVAQMQYSLQAPPPPLPPPPSPYDPRAHPLPYHPTSHNLHPIQPHPPLIHPQSLQPHPPPQPSPYAYQPPPPHPQTHYGLSNGNGSQYQNVLPHGTPPATFQTEAPRKRNRVQKACDVCAERKVKCSSNGPGNPPCTGCVSLNRDCTYHRDSKRRGPTSKWREDGDPNKRQRTDDAPYDPHPNPQSQSPEINRETASTLALMARGANGSYPQAFSDSPRDLGVLLCDKVLIDRLIDDFFTCIHPLTPFPHEPSFRKAYEEHAYRQDPKFLALLCSMIAALVSSFPRKPRERMRDLGLDHQFPSALAFIERCHVAATEARGLGYLDNKLSIYDGCTSYFLGLAAAYSFNWRRTRLYLSETLTIIRCLGAHRADVQQIHSVPVESDPPLPVDYIQQQIGRRLFWTIVAGIFSIHQIGATHGELFIPPQNSTNPYPPLPDEIDDKYFDASGKTQQPYGIFSRLVGFNINCKIYSSCASLEIMELAYGIDLIYDWDRQKRVLNECYENVERVMQAIPPELLLKPSPHVGEFAPTDGFSQGRFGSEGKEDTLKRLYQLESQKANIYASQLCTRSYLVEKFFNLRDAYMRRGGAAEENSGVIETALQRKNLETRVSDEREGIVREFLHVLGNISYENMEPNGLSFINKVRMVASTLMETNENRKGPLAIRAQESLEKLLAILMKFDRGDPGLGADPDSTADEEDLRIWADLKDVQLRFLHAGGFMADT